LAHAIEAFKDIELQIGKNQLTYETELKELTDQIDTEEGKTFRSINKHAVQLRLINLKDSILENIQQIERIYGELPKLEFTQDEFEIIRDRINKNANNNQVPNIPLEQLKSLLNTKLIKNGTIKVIMEVPIVLRETFTEYFVVPMPNVSTGEIADIEPHKIVVNQLRQEYIEVNDIIAINETLGITQEDCQLFKNAKITDDCAISVLLTETKTCKTRKLSVEYDQWMVTPLHNVIAFYSTKKNTLICNGQREIIAMRAGTIRLPSGCVVETEALKIKASEDKTSISRQAYHIEVIPDDEDEITEKYTSMTHQKKITPIDDAALDKVLIEVKEPIESNHLMWWIIGSVIICVIIVGIIGSIVVVKYLKRDRTTNSVNAIYEPWPLPAFRHRFHSLPGRESHRRQAAMNLIPLMSAPPMPAPRGPNPPAETNPTNTRPFSLAPPENVRA
jgi:hypothetical protein